MIKTRFLPPAATPSTYKVAAHVRQLLPLLMTPEEIVFNLIKNEV